MITTKLELNFPLLGHVILLIKDKKLGDFSKRQLKNYVIKEEFIKEEISNVEINLSGKKKENMKIINQKYSRNIKVENNILTQNFKNHFKTYEFSTGKYKIIEKSTLKNTLKKIKKNRYSSLHSRFYEYVLFPIFDLYALFEGLYLMHGSSLKVFEKNIMIIGLDGVGKTSLTNLLEEESGEIYSDNFILTNGVQVIPFNLPLRLANNEKIKNNAEILYQNKNFREVYYEQKQEEKIGIDKIFLIFIGSNNIIEKIEIGIEDLLLISEGASEINGANNSLLSMFFVNKLMFKNNRKNQIELKVDMYKLGIKKGELKKGVELIKRCH